MKDCLQLCARSLMPFSAITHLAPQILPVKCGRFRTGMASKKLIDDHSDHSGLIYVDLS